MVENNKVGFVQRFKDLSRFQKIILGCVAAFLVYTVIGFLVLPPVVKMVLEKKLPEALNRKVAIQKIKINPYILTVAVEGFVLDKRSGAGSFVAFESLLLDLEVSSIFKRAIIVKSVSLTKPRVSFSRNSDQSFSFSDLAGGKPGPEHEEKPDAPLLFSINNGDKPATVVIVGGRRLNGMVPIESGTMP